MDLSNLIRKQRPNIKDNSLNGYLISLKKLNNNNEIKNLNFLKNRKNILTMIEPLALTTRKNRLTAILVGLGVKDGNEEFDKIKKQYAEDLYILTKEYTDNIRGKKTEKEEKNWTTISELSKITKEYKKQINDLDLNNREKPLSVKQKLLLQHYILTLLYTKLSPMRLDYNVIIVKSEKDIDTQDNYLINKSKNKKYFVIQDYKTSKQMGTKTIELDTEIVSAINLWLKFNKTEFLFTNNRNSRQSSNGLGKMVTNAFKPTGKNITLNLIRKIYISENIDKQAIEKSKKLAEDMGHSVATQQLVYHKD